MPLLDPRRPGPPPGWYARASVIIHRVRPRLILLPLALLLPACPDDKGTTDTTTASSGTTDSTVGMSSAPTTGDVSVTNSESSDLSEGLSSGSSAATEAGTSTTAESTTGDTDIPGLCSSLCMRSDECMLGFDPDDCAVGCTGDHDHTEGECRDAAVTYLGCLVDMTCEQLQTFFNTDDPGPCAQQSANYSTTCSDVVCRSGASGNPDGTECQVTVTCPDQPLQAMQCDTETCTCLTDGKPTGMCPADGVCMNLATAPLKTLDCCGF